MDAAPAAEDRPAGHLRPDPEQRRPDGVARAARPRRRPPPPRRASPAGARPDRLDPARLPDVPPVRVHAGVGRAGLGLLPWQRAGRAASTADPALRASARRRGPRPRRRPDRAGLHAARSGVYLLGDPPDYEPGPDRSVAGIAAARGADVWETFLDLLLADDGRELLNSPVLNYSDGNLDAAGEMLLHPIVRVRARRRRRPRRPDLRRVDDHLPAVATGPATAPTGRLPVELAVHKLTQATATLYGLGDRGVLAPGFVGDLNVIDHDAAAAAPARDGRRPARRRAPADPAGRRLRRHGQGRRGHLRDGEHTGARPGALLRGAR